MNLDLHGRCAIVCAASRGLGRATAFALAREGASVAICARSEGPLVETAAAIQRETGALVVPIVADVGRAADAARVVAESAQRLGGIDILVTNTGGPKSALFATLSDDDWREAIDSILMSVVWLARGVIPHMKARGGGRILTITSISAKQPVEGLVLSNALRAGVMGLARTLANELAADNILVSCVAPGRILGHEGVGVVEAVGESVTDFKPGEDKVDLTAFNFDFEDVEDRLDAWFAEHG